MPGEIRALVWHLAPPLIVGEDANKGSKVSPYVVLCLYSLELPYFRSIIHPNPRAMKRRLLFLLLSYFLFLSTVPAPRPAFRPGKDRAIFFAVEKYQNGKLTNLQNPVKNAREIAAELKKRFGFETEVLENPTQEQIIGKLNELTRLYARNEDGKHPADGQLFLFFSGHGMSEDENGYFLPADADPAKPYEKGIAYEIWRPKIDKINCRHILVAIDACYSVRFDPDWKNKPDGTFKRPGEMTDAQRALANYEAYKARVFFTSDNKDDQTPNRSNFARKLLEGLRTATATDSFLTSKQLFANHIEGATPTPRAGTFGSDEPSSAFLFYDQVTAPKSEATPKETPTDLTDWNTAKAANTIESYQAYLKKHPSGDFAEAAMAKITALHTAAPNSKPNTPNTTQTPENSSVAADGLVFVKGGTFAMGCTSEQGSDCAADEKPTHLVTLSDFYIGQYEVTQAEWRKVMGSDPPKLYNKGCDQCPVENASWGDIQEFLKTLNSVTKSGYQYRLPTEAEWEYAARGGGSSRMTKYAGSNSISDVAWYSENYKTANTYGLQKTTQPVGTKASNELSLFDMSGNVWEWCSDWYGDYASSAQTNPTGPTSGADRVIRGGSWFGDPQFCRVANRYDLTPDARSNDVGFRLARTR